MDPGASLLLTDLYQLNMIEAYLAHGETKTAVFELFVRRLPARRGFLIAAGLEQALEFLEDLRFSADEIGWLKDTSRFSARMLAYFSDFRFTGTYRLSPAPPRGRPGSFCSASSTISTCRSADS